MRNFYISTLYKCKNYIHYINVKITYITFNHEKDEKLTSRDMMIIDEEDEKRAFSRLVNRQIHEINT